MNLGNVIISELKDKAISKYQVRLHTAFLYSVRPNCYNNINPKQSVPNLYVRSTNTITVYCFSNLEIS